MKRSVGLAVAALFIALLVVGVLFYSAFTAREYARSLAGAVARHDAQALARLGYSSSASDMDAFSQSYFGRSASFEPAVVESTLLSALPMSVTPLRYSAIVRVSGGTTPAGFAAKEIQMGVDVLPTGRPVVTDFLPLHNP